MNNILIAFFGAVEDAFLGLGTTGEPHIRKFDIKKFRIDDRVYSSNQAFKSVYQDLSGLGSLDNDLQGLRNVLLVAISNAAEASDRLVAALERTSTDSYGNKIPFPDWSKGNSTRQEFVNCVNKLDRSFVSTYVEKIRKENPGMESFLLPYFLIGYENKDKKPEEIAAENSKLGRCIFNFENLRVFSSVLEIPQNGPAARR